MEQPTQAGEMRIQYHDETPRGARIKVIGVGGGGGNAVNRTGSRRAWKAWSSSLPIPTSVRLPACAPVKLQLGGISPLARRGRQP